MSSKKNNRFRKELQSFINKYSIENGSDTPDFILANYLIGCLRSFEEAINQRDTFYNHPKKSDPKKFILDYPQRKKASRANDWL